MAGDGDGDYDSDMRALGLDPTTPIPHKPLPKKPGLITPEYQKQLFRCHEVIWPDGELDLDFARGVKDKAIAVDATSVLDYGCGKGGYARIFQTYRNTVSLYDPGVPEFSKLPEPVDLVVSRCVLEHVEPECIDNVLAHIHRLAKKAVFLRVATFHSKLRLPDGRGVHLIVEEMDWWLVKLMKHWRVMNANVWPGGAYFQFFGLSK